MKDEQRAVSVKPERFTNRQLLALIGPLLLEQILAIGVGLADSLIGYTAEETMLFFVE